MSMKQTETPMEQWEIDMRAKLEEEIPHGAHNIGFGDWVVITGKGGKINSIIEIERQLRGHKGISEQVKQNYFPTNEVTIKDLKEMMKFLENKNNQRNEQEKSN